MGFGRINTIAGVDAGKNIELVYYFSKESELLKLKTKLVKQNPQIDSIIEIYPGAVILERELTEMLGVKVIGNKFTRTFLPENWKGKPPLRKDFKIGGK
jgi:NADH-quinone oxidoreductase subunit C